MERRKIDSFEYVWRRMLLDGQVHFKRYTKQYKEITRNGLYRNRYKTERW
jgi:hypothetical protein